MSLTYFIESLGCVSNQTDTFRVKQFLEANGYRPATADVASLLVLMTCGFDQHREDHNVARIVELQQLKRADAELVVGGCLPGINKPRVAEVFQGRMFTPRTLIRLNDVIKASEPIEGIPGIFPDASTGMHVVRVSTGCMHDCAFCAIPFANGRTLSRPIPDIVSDLRGVVEAGGTAVRLVSEDVGAYGMDSGSSIIGLLEALAAADLPLLLHLDYMNMQWLFKYADALFPLLQSDQVAKHFYWPVQSGSDRVLGLMQRGYTVAQARQVLDRAFATFEGLEVTSDFIVGFPGERDVDFEQTRSLLKAYPFFYANVFRYEERPRTPAAVMPSKVDPDVTERRFELLVRDALEILLQSRNVASLDQLRRVSASPSGLLNVNSSLPEVDVTVGGNNAGSSR